MNHPYFTDIMAAITGFLLVVIHHYTGFLSNVFLFEYFSSEMGKAFMLGVVGAFGGLLAKQVWGVMVKLGLKLFRIMITRKKPKRIADQ